MMHCAICYHLRNLKNKKNTHKGVLIFVKLQAKDCNFTPKATLFYVCFFRFRSCTNGTKSINASKIILFQAKVPFFILPEDMKKPTLT